MSSDLRQAVEQCAGHGEFLGELARVYRETDGDALLGSAVCDACGRCCRFDEAPHRLYVSTGELAILTRCPPPNVPAALRCAYQVGPACHARDARPLGCRVYFCRQNDSSLGEALYERQHHRIRGLHDRFALPYRYVELTAALSELASACGDTTSGQ